MTTEAQNEGAISAPYGKSCGECAQSKTKCILTPRGGACQRCRRLNRECRPAPTRRGQPRPTIGNKHLHAKSLELQKSDRSSKKTDFNKSSPQKGQEQPSLISSFGHPLSTGGLGFPTNLSPVEADECLANFVATKLQYFPVCHISTSLTSHQLRDEYPFLWLSIMAVSSDVKSRKNQLNLAFKSHLSHAMLRRSEQSLDLLLGLLVMFAWNHHSMDMDTKIPLAMLSQLAVGLVYELGLNSPPRSRAQYDMCIGRPRPTETSQTRAMEERRAVLGCFVMTSIISSFLKKSDALRWTTHLAESLSEVATRQECLNDSILVLQVQAQLAVERANMSRWYDEAVETVDVLKAPPNLYVQPLHAQIGEAKKCLPILPLPRSITALHLFTAELMVNELTLSCLLASTSHNNMQKLKFLMACLNSIKAWFDTFFTIPIIQYTNFSFAVMTQLLQCLHLLYYLTIFEDSTGIGWNIAEVRSSLDVLEVIDLVLSNLLQVNSSTKMDKASGPDFFSLTIQQISFVRTAWAAKLEENSSRTENTGSSATILASAEEELLHFEYWNSAWLDNGWSSNFEHYATTGGHTFGNGYL